MAMHVITAQESRMEPIVIDGETVVTLHPAKDRFEAAKIAHQRIRPHNGQHFSYTVFPGEGRDPARNLSREYAGRVTHCIISMPEAIQLSPGDQVALVLYP
ncbi:hypothetical protein HYV74_01470 [Candidatus Uhrbacteria bacterium]|nr:hypothetical protein [Candidatus Uhrbacteria bacterium]